MLSRAHLLAIVAALLLGSACPASGPRHPPADAAQACPSARSYTASPWPEADALFRQSDRWAGADAAFTVDLGNDRILWLFGDTVVSKTPGSGRSGAFFPRNTVGIQAGRDPSKATMTFFWGHAGPDGAPSSFFAGSGDRWLWPWHGARLGDRLVLFFQEIVSEKGGLGFRAVGGVALAVDNPDAEPPRWTVRRLQAPAHPFGAILGVAAIVQGGSLFAVSLVEPGSHDALLARWPLADAQAGALASPQWWSGSAWSSPASATSSPPAAIWKAGAPELSVQLQPRCAGYATVQSLGFGSTTIAIATAPALTGPWSAFTPVYRPPESSRPGVLVYAAKSHPELAGAQYVVTYATNSMDLATLANDLGLYFPRFVRVNEVP